MNLFRSRPIVDLTPEELAPESLVELHRNRANNELARLQFDRESRVEEITRLRAEIADIDLAARALSAALEVLGAAGDRPPLRDGAGAPRLPLARSGSVGQNAGAGRPPVLKPAPGTANDSEQDDPRIPAQAPQSRSVQD